MELKKKLAGLRKGKGLTQLELAEALSVSRQAVSRWEVGTAVPSLDNLVSLSRLYGVPVDYLVHDELEKLEETKNEPADSVGGGRKRTALLRPLALALSVLMAGVVIGVTAAGQVRSGEAAAVSSFRGVDVFYEVFAHFELQIGMGWIDAKPILKAKCPQLFSDEPKPVPVDGRVVVDGPVGYLEPIN